MRILINLSAFAVLAGLSRVVLAQSVYGYNVSWGTNAVPVSPWVSAAIGLLLVLAAYAFFRRHAGQGLFMLATATLVGALSLHTGNAANANILSLFSITSPSGSQFFDCTNPAYSGYQNDTGDTLRLNLAQVSNPVTAAPAGTAPGGPVLLLCHVGDQNLPPGGACYMPCAAD